MRLNPTRTRPFDIIGKLLSRHASKKSDFTGFSEASTDGESAQEVKGSAGFFFWETRRGYNFFLLMLYVILVIKMVNFSLNS